VSQPKGIPDLENFSQSRIPLKPFYKAEDREEIDPIRELSDPGSYPFTRGRFGRVSPHGTWIQRELSGEGEPSRSNEQLKYLIRTGQTGIDVIGDSPTMACMDPDHPFAVHAVGTQGVSLCCLQDYRDLFLDLPLNALTVSSSVPAMFAVAGLYLAAQERGMDPAQLRGSAVQAPFYCEDCGYSMRMPFALRLRMTSDSIEFCSRKMPRFHSFLEDTYFISEAGLDSVEEMALGFVEIRHVVRDLLARGLDIDRFGPRIGILVNCRMDFFEEIAKIRATRRLFARMMKEDFGAKDPRAWSAVITSHTSGLSLTAQQPFNNIVRGALQALSLVLAGVQAVEISAFDEAFRTPSPESHLVGLRTQQVIALESNVAKVLDPLGGSYYIEALTDEMEARIGAMVREIEAMGDPAALSDKGWFRQLFDRAMERYARQVREGELIKVGVNAHTIPTEEDTLLRDVTEKKIEPCWGRRDSVGRFRESRDRGKVCESLRAVHEVGRASGSNLMVPVLEAMKSGATMGEIAGVLRMAYGFPYDPWDMTEPPCAF
jgi:methylmalonyl-CoA mutase, N-terminal domain